mgnify:CR=1 FL=1
MVVVVVCKPILVFHFGPNRPGFKLVTLDLDQAKQLCKNMYPRSDRGAMAKASGAEVPGKHDDVVLIQLVLTQLAKCSPFPQLMVSQASWPYGGVPMQTSQIGLGLTSQAGLVFDLCIGRKTT